MHPVTNRNILTGIILSGGQGKRINNPDKGLLKIADQSIIERLINIINPLFEEILIVTDRQNHYRYLKARSAVDIMKNKGPLGGIHSGLVNSKTFYNFVFASDMPFVNSELLRYMIEQIENNDCILPIWRDKIEPLCAIYSKKCVDIIEKNLLEEKLKIAEIFPRLRIRYVTEEEIKRFDPEGSSFINVNSQEEYEKVK